MAITRIASQDALGSTSAADNASATYAAVPTPGNLLIAVVWGAEVPPILSISGSNWTMATELRVGSGTGAVAVFYKIARTAEPTTITGTATGATAVRIHIYEYRGTATTDVFIDASSVGEGLGATVTTRNTGTVAVSGGVSEYLLFTTLAVAGGAITVPSWDSGFSLRQEDAAIRIFDGDLVATSAGDYTANASWTTARLATGVILAFRASDSNAPGNARYMRVGDGMSIGGVAS